MMLHNDGDKVVPRLAGARVKVSASVPMPVVDSLNGNFQHQPRPPGVRYDQIAAAPKTKRGALRDSANATASSTSAVLNASTKIAPDPQRLA